jgi:flagella basal body P-ring formation protein FlgA
MITTVALGYPQLILRGDILLPYSQDKLFFSDFFDFDDSIPSSLEQQLKKIIFDYAPLPGKQIRYNTDYIISKINHYFPEITPISDTETITILRASKDDTITTLIANPISFPKDNSQESNPTVFVTPERWEVLLRDNLRDYLQKNTGEEIPSETFDIVINKESPVSFPIESWTIKYTKFGKSEYFVQLEAKPENGVVYKWTGKIEPVWIRNIAVANRNIRYKETVQDDAVTYQPLNFFSYREPLVEGSQFPKIASSYIKEGTVIETGMLKDPPYVKAGQVIFALIIIGGVEARGMVEILKDAQIGDIVQARNIETGVLVTGKIEEGPILRIY